MAHMWTQAQPSMSGRPRENRLPPMILWILLMEAKAAKAVKAAKAAAAAKTVKAVKAAKDPEQAKARGDLR